MKSLRLKAIIVPGLHVKVVHLHWVLAIHEAENSGLLDFYRPRILAKHFDNAVKQRPSAFPSVSALTAEPFELQPRLRSLAKQGDNALGCVCLSIHLNNLKVGVKVKFLARNGRYSALSFAESSKEQ